MKKLIFPAIVLIGLLSSCGRQSSNETSSEKYDAADIALSSKKSADSEISLDSTRQYLQEAYIKMQVKKLQETKELIRQIVRQQKGFILESELQNNVLDEKTVELNKDSALSIRKVSVGNSYSLKIPARNLDSTIFLLQSLGIRIDNSSQKAEDITMQWMQNNSVDNDNTIDDLRKVQATNNAGINKVMTMHELRKEKRTATLENKELAYNIRYSDLKLDIFEAPLLQTLAVANTDQYNTYTTPFGYQLKNALAQGVELFKMIIVGIAHLWLIILTTIAFFILWKMYRKKRASTQNVTN